MISNLSASWRLLVEKEHRREPAKNQQRISTDKAGNTAGGIIESKARRLLLQSRDLSRRQTACYASVLAVAAARISVRIRRSLADRKDRISVRVVTDLRCRPFADGTDDLRAESKALVNDRVPVEAAGIVGKAAEIEIAEKNVVVFLTW